MKFGAFSAILSKKEYEYINFKKNNSDKVLLKVTHYQTLSHNGEKTLINLFDNDNDYVYKIYKNSITNINLNPNLYKYFKESIDKYDKDRICKLLTSTRLIGYFIEDLGDFDVFDALTDLIYFKKNIWGEKNKFNDFIIHMCYALKYLESFQICHFDIKPENIMIKNTLKLPFEKRFKLIDFGFAEEYPFKNYSNKLIGTKYYVPYYQEHKEYPEWHLKINCNDWYRDENYKLQHYIKKKQEYNLIYKTDVFSLGMVFQHILFYIKYYNKKKTKIENFENIELLIKHMTHYDIEQRFTYNECLNYLLK